MSTPNPGMAAENGALRGDLRPCEHSPRSFPYPETRPFTQIGDRR